MAATDDALSPPDGTICFFISDVDGYYGGVRDMPYGLREPGIRDCNGNALAFAQQD